MNKRRLLKLAELLDADAKNRKGIKFDMSNWGKIGDPAKPISCGTQACAMGLAALSGAFKRAGLSYYIEDNFLHFKMNGVLCDGYTAAAELFDINPWQADDLFSPSLGKNDEGAAGERAKAKEIRQFVKTGDLD